MTSGQWAPGSGGHVTDSRFPVSDLQSRLDALEEAFNSSTTNQQLSLVQGHFLSLTHSPTHLFSHSLTRPLTDSLTHSLSLSWRQVS